jgi:hypothetical protein
MAIYRVVSVACARVVGTLALFTFRGDGGMVRPRDFLEKENEEMKSFETFKELQTKLDKDRPGALAKATTAIGRSGINIEGFCQVDGDFHVVTSDPSGAKKALETAGYKVQETDVIAFPAEDRPGFLADVLNRFSENEINVGAAYTLGDTRVVIASDQVSKMKTILQEYATTGAARR